MHALRLLLIASALTPSQALICNRLEFGCHWSICTCGDGMHCDIDSGPCDRATLDRGCAGMCVPTILTLVLWFLLIMSSAALISCCLCLCCRTCIDRCMNSCINDLLRIRIARLHAEETRILDRQRAELEAQRALLRTAIIVHPHYQALPDVAA